MMELDVAQKVIEDIAAVIQTNGIFTGKNGYNIHVNANSSPDRRLRSKSLGAEPAKELDVDFLGKILQETMCGQQQQQQTSPLSSEYDFGTNLTSATSGLSEMTSNQSLSNEDFYPMSEVFPPPMSSFANNGSALLSRDRQVKKHRHVSFDETYATSFDDPQCREPYSFGPTTEEADVCLGASLGFLDLEEDDEANDVTDELREEPTAKEDEEEMRGTVVSNGGTAADVIDSELAQCHPVSGFPDLAPAGKPPQDRTNEKPPTNPKRGSKKRSSKKEADELAAALFVSNTRPRSNSMPLSVSQAPSSFSHASKRVSSSKSSVSLCPTETSATTQSTDNNSAVIESTTEILLTMNYHLGHEAASLASQLSYGDLNLAQYLIEAARSITAGNGVNSYHQRRRSRICRHELQGTCYRHDCPYSHDIAGVTCLFWLKGRCHHTDGSSCRFMHGFAESLLEGVNEDYLKEQQQKQEQERLQMEEEKRNQAVFVPTTNLLQRNEWASEKSHSSPMFGNGLWSSPSTLENR